MSRKEHAARVSDGDLKTDRFTGGAQVKRLSVCGARARATKASHYYALQARFKIAVELLFPALEVMTTSPYSIELFRIRGAVK